MDKNYDVIKGIQKKYSESIFMMAITHLFETGINPIKDADIEAECKKIIAVTPNYAIITGEFQTDILRCAAELSKLPLWDVLRFVKTDVGIYGATVHPGIIIEFRRNATDKEILTCVIPSGTDEDIIEDVLNQIEADITEQASEKGSYRLLYEDFIRSAFKKHGIRPQAVIPDKTICL